MRSCVLAPTSAMNRGISGTVKAMIAAEIQSPPQHRRDHGDGHDHGQQQLRQVQREVAVERVDAAGREDRELACALLAGAVQSERRDPLQQRGAQL